MNPEPPQISSPTIQEEYTSNLPLFCIINTFSSPLDQSHQESHFLILKNNRPLGPICLPSNCSISLLFTATHWITCIVSNSLFTSSSSFCPQFHQNCSFQGHLWLHMVHSLSPHLTWFRSFICFQINILCFQDTRISTSSFTSHPPSHSFSVSFLVLLHLLDPYVLDHPGISPWSAFLFYLPTWLLHLMSNRCLEFNLSPTEHLVFSFRIRSSQSLSYQ